MAEDDSLTRPLLTDNSKNNLNSGFVYPAEGGIVLQPNSVLDRHRVRNKPCVSVKIRYSLKVFLNVATNSLYVASAVFTVYIFARK